MPSFGSQNLHVTTVLGIVHKLPSSKVTRVHHKQVMFMSNPRPFPVPSAQTEAI